jgi:hypothetical protein
MWPALAEGGDAKALTGAGRPETAPARRTATAIEPGHQTATAIERRRDSRFEGGGASVRGSRPGRRRGYGERTSCVGLCRAALRSDRSAASGERKHEENAHDGVAMSREWTHDDRPRSALLTTLGCAGNRAGERVISDGVLARFACHGTRSRSSTVGEACAPPRLTPPPRFQSIGSVPLVSRRAIRRSWVDRASGHFRRPAQPHTVRGPRS